MNLSVLVRIMNLESVIQRHKEKKNQLSYICTYIWKLEKLYWIIYFQGRNVDTYVENGLWTQWEKESIGRMKKLAWIYIYTDILIYPYIYIQISSTVMSDSLWLHWLQNARLPCLSPIPWRLLKLMPIESVMSFNHLILCCPLLLLPSIFPSIRVFSTESVLYISWPMYWTFSFSISYSNEYSGLISFRIEWLDHLPGQGTLKRLLQHHSSKTSIIWCSAYP